MTNPPPLAWWRIVAGIVVLAMLAYLGLRLLPLYFHDLELQSYVEKAVGAAENRTAPDDVLRTRILNQALALDLPVKSENVQIKRLPAGPRIEIRYVARVELPLYTVDLHFHSGAGAR